MTNYRAFEYNSLVISHSNNMVNIMLVRFVFSFALAHYEQVIPYFNIPAVASTTMSQT